MPKFLLDFDIISIGSSQWWDVQEIHLGLDVPMQSLVVFQNHMPLGVFDTQLGVQGMEGIGEIQNFLAPLLS